LDWPSKSPDLNSIERVWDYAKDEISIYQFTGANQQTVEQAKSTLERVWQELSQDYIDSCCRSFHEKLELVILHRGG
ncbi:transposable element Tc3 transposase, partial [Tuber indicum]